MEPLRAQLIAEIQHIPANRLQEAFELIHTLIEPREYPLNNTNDAQSLLTLAGMPACQTLLDESSRHNTL